MGVDVSIAGNATIALTMVIEALVTFLRHYGVVAISAVAVALVTFVGFWALRESKYAAVPYSVSIPEQCQLGWVGKVLEKPSIKVVHISSSL